MIEYEYVMLLLLATAKERQMLQAAGGGASAGKAGLINTMLLRAPPSSSYAPPPGHAQGSTLRGCGAGGGHAGCSLDPPGSQEAAAALALRENAASYQLKQGGGKVGLLIRGELMF